MAETTALIRPYRPADHDAVYDVCVRTADAGGDARGLYHSDDLMPDLIALHYRPERLVWPGLGEYPAHLHIDLLPPFQGAGHGRALMETFYAAAAGAGAAGVHVTVAKANTGAIGFYRRLGFRPLEVADPDETIVTYLGRAL